MECDICMMEWDSQIRIPRLLSCGHTFCESCLISILKSSISKQLDLLCPTCMSKHIELKKEEDIKSLIKNYNLLRIVEKLEARKTVVLNQTYTQALNLNQSENYIKFQPFQPIISEKSDIKINSSIMMRSIRGCEVDSGLIENPLLSDQICKKHMLPVHSYAIGTNLLVCNICVKSTNLKTHPLPNVIKDLKTKIDSSRMKICLLKSEIDRLKDFFLSYRDEFEKTNNVKIEELFNYLHKIITYNYNTAMQLLNQCSGEQKMHIDQRMKELDDLHVELNEAESEFSKINIQDERELIKQNEQINKLQQKINFFINYELELDLLSMKIGVKDESRDKLFTTIQESYFVDAEFMQIKGELPTVKHILQKDKYWSCICGELNNPILMVRCQQCSNFRRLETIENLHLDPMNITPANLKLISLRRKEESKDFQEFIKLNNIFVKQFYVVDLEWFLQWKCFIMNDSTEKILVNSKKKNSSNKSIGVLPPGPVSNVNLFEKNASSFSNVTLKKSLKKNEDYVIVNEKIWNLYLNNYNGGPEILLNNNNDIYSSLVSIFNNETSNYAIIKQNLLLNINSNINETEIYDNHDLEEFIPLRKGLSDDNMAMISNEYKLLSAENIENNNFQKK